MSSVGGEFLFNQATGTQLIQNRQEHSHPEQVEAQLSREGGSTATHRARGITTHPDHYVDLYPFSSRINSLSQSPAAAFRNPVELYFTIVVELMRILGSTSASGSYIRDRYMAI